MYVGTKCSSFCGKQGHCAMSRCFPFPPPGYDRKQRPEDLEILKEEKRKEKKHKKEKKDRERKEGKEKKEKDRSDDKPRVKKDRKGKHKDKNDKEKGRGKEKSSISEEATVGGKLEVNNGEKFPTKGGHNKDTNIFVDETKQATQFQGQNGGKYFHNSLHSRGIEESKCLQELDRRIRNDEKASGSQLLDRVSGADKRDQDTAVSVAFRDSSGVLAEDNGKLKDKRVDNRQMGVQGFSNEFSGNAMGQNVAGIAKRKVEEMPRPAEEQNNKILPSKEKSKEKGDNNGDDKPKDRGRDKKRHKIDKEKEREKKKEKTKGKSQTEETSQVRSKDVGRNEVGGDTSYKRTHMLEGIDSSAVSEGNSRKRKDLDSNGFLHDSEVRHNKLQRLTSHQLTENGRKIESARVHCISALDKQGFPINFSLDNKDSKVNGIIEGQKLSTKPKPSAVSMFSDQIILASKKSPLPDSKHINGVPNESMMEDQTAKASNRPPHPDTKYLSEILSVPKMEWPNVDDQEWLFTQKEPSSNSKVSSAAVNEELHVWSEAVHIESADIYALPYVVPY
ncbi:unnamed protein product [Fraxinus pennsylvanica]|uniref:Myb-like protein X n=1 Tax=Fraxinus pennsylvanica TaxID=56036 RepID=A0AAD1ZUT0_9LAMI|nr:unnamed protein product [Fraxinus pennsylvanica]